MVSAVIYGEHLYKDAQEAAIELDLPINYVRECVRLRKDGFRKVFRIYRVKDKMGREMLCRKSDRWWIPCGEEEAPMKIQWADTVDDITLAYYLKGATNKF